MTQEISRELMAVQKLGDEELGMAVVESAYNQGRFDYGRIVEMHSKRADEVERAYKAITGYAYDEDTLGEEWERDVMWSDNTGKMYDIGEGVRGCVYRAVGDLTGRKWCIFSEVLKCLTGNDSVADIVEKYGG